MVMLRLAMLLVCCVGCTSTVVIDGEETSGSSGGPSPTLGNDCESNAGCVASEYCHGLDFGCDPATAFQATCRERPTVCEHIADPVCACDGEIYGNECEANAAGVQIKDEGPTCVAPPGQFQCGAHFCDSASEYCEAYDRGSHLCKPWPADCGDAPSCASCFSSSLPVDCVACVVSGSGFELRCM